MPCLSNKFDPRSKKIVTDNSVWHDVGTQPVCVFHVIYLWFSIECFAHFTSFERPAWSTGILIPASFLCGIIAAIFIWRGGQKTKRTKQVEERLRHALAMDLDDHENFLKPPESHRFDDTAGASTPATPPAAVPAATDNHPVWSENGQEKVMREMWTSI